ncbi:MAG: hypothetical protein ACREA9_11395, partial [Pyrinomonadaceae bacterium]
AHSQIGGSRERNCIQSRRSEAVWKLMWMANPTDGSWGIVKVHPTKRGWHSGESPQRQEAVHIVRIAAKPLQNIGIGGSIAGYVTQNHNCPPTAKTSMKLGSNIINSRRTNCK